MHIAPYDNNNNNDINVLRFITLKMNIMFYALLFHRYLHTHAA